MPAGRPRCRHASGLLAENLPADLFVMATDVDGVYVDWARPSSAVSTE